MDSSDEDKNQTDSQVEEPATNKLKIEDTPISEYLEVVQKEYEYERDKKQSFENRSGLILTLVGGIVIFLVEKVRIKDLFIGSYLTIAQLVAIVIYGCFIYTFFQLYKVMKIEKHDTLGISEINCDLMEEDRVNGVARIILTYKDVIKAHRRLNNKRAKAFNKALIGLIVSAILVSLYINLV